MARKLKFLREGSRTSINSASQFLADIRGKVVRPEQIMVSFDVVSLFTSIPPDLARDVLRKRLEENYDEMNKPLKIDHLLQLFAFCQQTFFTFNGRTYEQIKGTPMGSPISSLVAELVLQELEKVAFDHYEPAFWRRYVDDTFVIIERSRLADFQDLLNGIFPVWRGDPLSQIATHTLEEGHEFNFASTRIVARASNKTGRELLEAWVSGTNSINRHVEIPPCYHALRSRGQGARPNFQPRVHAVTPP
nr:unnamed protein product [Spirometra erinaceieuropaei]